MGLTITWAKISPKAIWSRDLRNSRKLAWNVNQHNGLLGHHPLPHMSLRTEFCLSSLLHFMSESSSPSVYRHIRCLPFSTLVFETGSPLSPEHTDWLNCWVRKLQSPLSSLPPSPEGLELQKQATTPSFYVDVDDPNLGSHACIANTLPAKSPSHPFSWLSSQEARPEREYSIYSSPIGLVINVSNQKSRSKKEDDPFPDHLKQSCLTFL